MPTIQGTDGDTSGASVTPAAYFSAEIDFTATGTTLIVPAISGKRFVATRLQILNTVTAGTFSGACTFEFGNSSNTNNFQVATAAILVVGSHTAGVGGTINVSIASSASGGGEGVVVGESVVFKVNTGATGTGGFAWKGRIGLYGVYI